MHLAENELPEIDDLNERLVEMARRLGLRLVTCSGPVKDLAKRRGIAVTDLRPLANDLTPDHPPGEQLVIDLVKEGNQPRQALGYLSDGDMVVVNDASHLIGRENVVVEVLSTRAHHPGAARLRPPGRPAGNRSLDRRRQRPPTPTSEGTEAAEEEAHAVGR